MTAAQSLGSAYTIFALFITRKGDEDGGNIELLVAWDEATVDENQEGWNRAVEEALQSVGSDVREWRVAELQLPFGSVADLFKRKVVRGW